jgi:hypothetical protein
MLILCATAPRHPPVWWGWYNASPRVELSVQPVGRAPAFVQFLLPILSIDNGRDQEIAEAGSGPPITYPKHHFSYHVDT